MSLRKRIASPPSACRSPTEGFVPLTATRRVARVGAVLLGFLTPLGASGNDPGAAPDAHGAAPAFAVLATSVSETPDVVRLRIRASGEVEPGSVEIRFLGRKARVQARDGHGRTIRSELLRLPARVVEEGSSADYDADGALVMTFRKQATAKDARPTGDPEVVGRSRLDAASEPKGTIPR